MRRFSLAPAWRRLAAFLALLGIVTQLVAAATHHHGLGAASDPAVLPVADRADRSAPLPARDMQDESCAICLAVSIAATALVPAAIVLIVARAARAEPGVAVTVPSFAHWPDFRSRAPPGLLPST